MRVLIIALVLFFSSSLSAVAKCTKDQVCAMVGKMNHFAILDKCPNAGPLLVECRQVSDTKIEYLPEPNFVDNGDGTITDTVNKLLWIKKGKFGQKYKLKDAKTAALTAEEAGRTGWRLPTLPELKTLLYKERVINTSGKKAWINPLFDDGLGHYYWTTTTCDQVSVIKDRYQEKICQEGEKAAWFVHFNINAVGWFHTNLERPFVWLVQDAK
jgi:uncharacterized protein DUF1566